MRSEAQKRADKKYKEAGKDKYTNLTSKIHVDNIEKIKRIAVANGLTPSKYTARAVFYCANNNIDLSEYDEELNVSEEDFDKNLKGT